MPTAPPPAFPRASRRRRDALAVIAVLTLSALFLFAGAERPMFLWDESRNIANALEMDRSGIGLVTTWHGTPDLWNTKPPLLIWLMAGSVRLFGASLWALRLPSAVAMLATIGVVMLFVRRATGSIGTAVLAAAFLAASPGLFGEHGARTADYDPLLMTFVTAYLTLSFMLIGRRRPLPGTLALTAGCIVGAVLTKGIAGAMPGLGIGMYLLLTGRLRRLLDRRYAVAGIAVTGAILAFLILRERAAPGYLAASWYNDVAGRFADSLAGTRKPAMFYLSILWVGYFSGTLLLVAAPIVWRMASHRDRAVLLYSLCIAATLLATTTIAASKLHHYILPALPFMAIAAAIVLRTIRHRLRVDRGATSVALATIGLVAVALAVERGVVQRYIVSPPYEGAASGRYGALFDRLVPLGRRVVAVDPGFADHGDPHYAPVLYAYRLIWQRRGVAIGWATRPPALAGAILASCAPRTAALLLLREARDIGGVPGCAAVLRR